MTPRVAHRTGIGSLVTSHWEGPGTFTSCARMPQDGPGDLLAGAPFHLVRSPVPSRRERKHQRSPHSVPSQYTPADPLFNQGLYTCNTRVHLSNGVFARGPKRNRSMSFMELGFQQVPMSWALFQNVWSGMIQERLRGLGEKELCNSMKSR